MKINRFLAVLRARNTEFLRDRSSWAWNVIFPVLVVFVFAFAFSNDALVLYKVGVYGKSAQNQRLTFLETKHIQFIPITSPQLKAAVTKVVRHQLDMLLDTTKGQYWVNKNSPRGYMLERVLIGTGGARLTRQVVSGKEIRYVDWLIPGLLGMNMMFSALFGVGYVIVRYRKNGVLKRLKATPLTAFEFLAAQVVSRLWLIIALIVLVYWSTDLLVGFRMYGNYFLLLLVFVLGAICLISLGLAVAARISSEELANGLLNLLSWPMLLLSGVWFSLEGLHPFIQKMALMLPLTHITEAARAIMLDGAGLVEVGGHLLALILMSAVFLLVGTYSFCWE